MYAALVTLVTDEDNIVAGPIAAAVFVLLIAAVVFLGFSLAKRLRNVEKAEAAGLYDPSTKKTEKPADWPTTEEPTEPKE
jgi:4-hydroxybenzoate polyprenyltransferase